MALTFIKDQALFRVNLTSLVGILVTQEVFVDDINPNKIGEIVDFTDLGLGIAQIDYILVGTDAVQFSLEDTFTGDGGATAIINSTPQIIGTHHVHVIQIDYPANQITIQELVNEIRTYEETLPAMDHSTIAEASGKQDLGDGVLVGITLNLLDNWRVQFEARPGPIIESVSVRGGNIVATNSYQNNPIKPSPFTQVSVASSSSATISQIVEIQEIIQRNAFQGFVWIDTTYGSVGTAFPAGTISDPVNNLVDALIIASQINSTRINLQGMLTLGAGQSVAGYEICGNSPSHCKIVLNGESTFKSIFRYLEVEGVVNGHTACYNCHLQNLANFEGIMWDCVLLSDLSFAGSDNIFVNQCSDGKQSGSVILNINSGYRNVAFRRIDGHFKVINSNNSNNIIIFDFNSGQLEIDSSCVAGEIRVLGVAGLIDNRGPGLNVVTTGLLNRNIVREEANRNSRIFT